MAAQIEAQTRAALEAVDKGFWDVPGVGLVAGKYLTLEYAKLALALYGAKDRAVSERVSRLERILDARDFGSLAALEGSGDPRDNDDRYDDDDRDGVIDSEGNVRPR